MSNLTTPEENVNRAPFPAELDELVTALTYKTGWWFHLREVDRGQGSVELTLEITIRTPNSYNPDETRTVVHYMPVPPAAYDRRSWRRWLLDQILLVEPHEACEFFALPGERPFAPNHGPGRNPYEDVAEERRLERKASS